MRKRTIRRETIIALIICFVMSAVLLLFCSQSSPLYPLNLWDDANCLLTVGRVMRAGGVLYRDIYEQKGPTLYLIHGLAACMSDSSFLGVYVMQALSLAAALLFSYKTLRRRLNPPAALACAGLLAALTLTSKSFMQGGSAEEFCLPFLAAAVYLALSEYARQSGPMRPSRLFTCGLLAGLVATIKYTVLGLFVGLCLFEGVLALKTGGMRRALQSAGAFLAGMLLPVLIWCAYFAANGALSDFFTAYIYNNIFLYDAGEGAQGLLIAALRLVRDNAAWMVLTFAGLIAFAFLSRERRQARMALLAMGACAAPALLAGRLWTYCVLPLAAFAPVGLIGLGDALRRGLRAWKRKHPARAQDAWAAQRPRIARAARAFLPALAACAALVLAWQDSPNAYLRGKSLSDLAQGRLAARIEPGATLLQYSHLDDGLYLASGALPQGRFFVRLNVRYEEMIEELDRYVAQGEPDYVLVSWRELPEEFDRYELIAADTAYDDAGRLNKPLYLYRRKDG